MSKHSQLKTLATAMVAAYLAGATAWAQGVPDTATEETDETRMTAPAESTSDDSVAPSSSEERDASGRSDADTAFGANAEDSMPEGSLPATATPLWLLGLLGGGGLLGVAGALRVLRLRRRV
jgi:hypothetical protein